MRLVQLEYLQAVLKAGSFRGAARDLGVSQPTLSQQVRLLEEELDVLLLNRTGSKTVQTAEAAILVPHIARILQEVQYLRDQAGAIRGLNTGDVRIGTVTALSQTVLADALPAFRIRYPNVKFSVFEGPSAVIAERVRSGTIDLGLIAVAPDEAEEKGLVFITLFSDKTLLCVPKNFPIPKRSRQRLAAFTDAPWIVQGSGYARHRMLLRLTEGSMLNIVYESNNPNTTLRLVASGVGVALVSEISLLTSDSSDLSKVQLLSVDAPELELGMIARRDAMPPPAVREFKRFLQDAAARVSARLH